MRSPIELRELVWAIEASQHRSLRRASECLNVRQSTLSRCLQNLEYRLGAALFERTNGGTRTTSAGQEFLEEARRIVNEVGDAVSRFRSASRGRHGQLRIGVHASPTAGNLRVILARFKEQYPCVEVHVADGTTDYLKACLARGTADIAILVDNTEWSESSSSLWSERVVVAVPEGHRLADRKHVNWSDLTKESLLASGRGPGPALERLVLGKMGLRKVNEISRQDAALDRLLTLVAVRYGLLLMLEGATGIKYPGITYREIHGDDGPARLSFMAYWRRTNGNPTLQPFVDVLHECCPDISPDHAQE